MSASSPVAPASSFVRWELRDRQLVIGEWDENDAPAVHAACQDREIQPWIPVLARPYTVGHVAAKAGFQREGAMRSKFAHRDGYRIDSVMFSLLRAN